MDLIVIGPIAKLDRTSNIPKFRQYDKSKLEHVPRDIQNSTEFYRTAEKKTLGPSPILTSEEEALLVSWIKDNAAKDVPRKANDFESTKIFEC
ncbi:unnamed protein product [Acanthoscelides obtectus]|uniref:Uncharacterized protein n=1 Tax=Acanthoscelides obtectus TaxID=200917 RepID=A0A9P0LRA8_ACAOB|nr:unnamed protein product [Acanthoscelides obtectus]CAK1680287.1 hypothetical protein AOBTE_LOCUS32561 [Acanthoscelides obtectus]